MKLRVPVLLLLCPGTVNSGQVLLIHAIKWWSNEVKSRAVLLTMAARPFQAAHFLLVI
jgi:hypothetical protein